MDIRIVSDTITEAEIREIAREFYGSIIKGVADIEREVLALGGEYHSDALDILIDNGSRGEDVWGFNITLDSDQPLDERIEYISLINIRPAKGSRDMEIKDVQLKDRIRDIIKKRIENGDKTRR